MFTCRLFAFAALLLIPGIARAIDSATAPEKAPSVIERGAASYYSDQLQGKPTASGAPHDQEALTAASKDLPLGSEATVTNLKNGKSVTVKVQDRGPYKSGRVIDLSKRAAENLGIDKKRGVAPVKVVSRPAQQPTPELKEKVAQLGATKAKARTAAKRRAHVRGSSTTSARTKPTARK